MVSLDRLRPEVQRTLAITIPLLVAVFAGSLTVPKLVGLRNIRQLTEIRRQEAEARKQVTEAEIGRQHGERLAARPQSKDESLAFLRQLSTIVTSSGTHLVSYRPPARTAGNIGADAAGNGSSLVKPVATEVTLSGSYRDLVTLFRSLGQADRLFAVESLQVRTESYPRLSATFRLVRYVTPVTVVAVPPTACRVASGLNR
jgi:hypothetical protein